MLHNPVEDALTVSGKIILLEGNYLLLNEPGWSELRNYADYTVSVRAEEAFLRERLTDRKIKTGKDPEEAARFVDFSDMPNVRLCLEKTAEADLQLQLDRSGDYQLVSEKKNGETESGQ
jgi:pantothenate kinase